MVFPKNLADPIQEISSYSVIDNNSDRIKITPPPLYNATEIQPNNISAVLLPLC
jgi:hypothetical protein